MKPTKEMIEAGLQDYATWIDEDGLSDNERRAVVKSVLTAALSAMPAQGVTGQNEWLKARLAELQLPSNKRDHDTREKWLLQCGMPNASTTTPALDLADVSRIIEEGHEETVYQRFNDLFERGRAAGGFVGETQNLIRELTNAMRDAANWRANSKIAIKIEQKMRMDFAAENERLRAALEFYANPDIYKPHPHGPAFDRRDLSFHAKAALERKP